MWIWILSALVGLVFAVLLFLWNLSVFKKMKVKEMPIGDFWFFYVNFVGPYKDCGPTADRIHKIFKSLDIKYTVIGSGGIYWDDPGKIKAAECRSSHGIFVPKDHKLIDKCKEIAAKAKLHSVFITKRNSVITKFQLNPLLWGISYMVGAIKAYPALGKYISKGMKDDNDGSSDSGHEPGAMEICHMVGKKYMNSYIIPHDKIGKKEDTFWNDMRNLFKKEK